MFSHLLSPELAVSLLAWDAPLSFSSLWPRPAESERSLWTVHHPASNNAQSPLMRIACPTSVQRRSSTGPTSSTTSRTSIPTRFASARSYDPILLPSAFLSSIRSANPTDPYLRCPALASCHAAFLLPHMSPPKTPPSSLVTTGALLRVMRMPAALLIRALIAGRA